MYSFIWDLWLEKLEFYALIYILVSLIDNLILKELKTNIYSFLIHIYLP
jgi:hypothetical protein